VIGAWTPSLQQAALSASAMLLLAIGLIALLQRGHWLITLLFSSAFLALGALQAGALGLLHSETPGGAHVWADYLARVSALTSWLWLALSVLLGRPEPRRQLREAGAPLALSLVACVLLFALARSSLVLDSVEITPEGNVVRLGPLGQAYLGYLAVSMLLVLLNLEGMLRAAPASSQRRLGGLFLSILVAVLTELLVVAAGVLQGRVKASWLAAASPLLFVSGSAAALALARRRLRDMSVPVGRPVVYYSSVSITLAVAFLVVTFALSRVLPGLSKEFRVWVIVGFLVFVAGGAVLLMVQPATGRAIRRFVDRNFYAYRYDYRREWGRVSRALSPAAPPEEVCRQIESLARDIFNADHVAIHFREDPSGAFRLLHGPPGSPTTLEATHPLVRWFDRERWPVLFSDRGLAPELARGVEASRLLRVSLGAAACAPLAVDEPVIALLWLGNKRADEAWADEDLEFLAAMSRQLASALWFSRQAERIAEARQLESLQRLSSFVLHDMKNHVSGLSLVVDNARRHMGNPDFQRDAMAVVERTVRSLRELMAQVSGVSSSPAPHVAPCSLRELVSDALAESGLALASGSDVRVEVTVPEGAEAMLDRAQIGRVLVNLLVNAREAMAGPGTIGVRAISVSGADGSREAVIEVSDTGRGMSEEFIRTRLFKPFSTTKKGGLGVGLAQCRGIVEAHGGTIDARSRPGEGTVFTVRVPAGGPTSGSADGPAGDAAARAQARAAGRPEGGTGQHGGVPAAGPTGSKSREAK
jgi:putative PEP-CTERM system histidine kinase